jgi:hypothetical protein
MKRIRPPVLFIVRLVLDKLTGALSSFAVRGVELLRRGPEPNFWGARTHARYTVLPQAYAYAFLMEPLAPSAER